MITPHPTDHWAWKPAPGEAEELRRFSDALRAFLRLDPIEGAKRPKSESERFYLHEWPDSEERERR
jgi:hypothetical protein